MERNWINIGLKKGFSDVEIYLTRNKSLELEVYQGKVEALSNSDVTKIIIKGIYDDKMVRGSLANLNGEAVSEVFDKLILNAKTITVKEPAVIFEGSKEYPEIIENDFDFDSVKMDDKINYLIDLEKIVLNEPLVKQVESTAYYESYGETKIINSAK